jgi:ketosteroid isomerase-like protein
LPGCFLPESPQLSPESIAESQSGLTGRQTPKPFPLSGGFQKPLLCVESGGPSRDTAWAMSQENVELLYRSYDAVNRRDLDGLLALMDDDVEAVSRIAAMEGGLHGHDGMRRWWESWLGAFPDYKIEVDAVRDRGDFVFAALRAQGHGAGSQLPFEDTLWHASRWRRGKCIWWRVFPTWAEALEAAGLSE